MSPSNKRRFIAGAVCPRCKAMDTIVVYRENEQDYRECVNCDFSEQASFARPAEELPTRIRPSPSNPDSNNEVQIVKIVNPKK